MSKVDPAYSPDAPPPGSNAPPPPAYAPQAQGQPGQGPTASGPPPQGQGAPPPSYSQAQYTSSPGYPTQQWQQPQSGQAPPLPPGHVQIITAQTDRFSEVPKQMTCTKCHQNITTDTSRKIGLMVWAIFGGIILLGLVVMPLFLLGCCFIPFCIPSMKDTVHTCPNCKQHLGTYERHKSM